MKSSAGTSHIVVRAPNWVGDAVMATPFFTSLRKVFPEAAITCLCRPMVADIYRFHPDINRVLELDESSGRSGWHAIRGNAARLKPERFDVAISLPNSLSSALMFFLAGIPKRIGYRADWRRVLLTKSMPFPKKGRRPHRVEYYLRLLDLLADNPVYDRQLKLIPGEEAAGLVAGELVKSGLDESSIFVTIAPGAAQPNKMWMPERFAELVRRLADRNVQVVFVGGPKEKELAEHVALQADVDGLKNMVGAGPLLFTAELIRRSAVFVGNDSGLAHVAAAVGTPAIVLSGPGDPTEVAPYADNAVTLAEDLFCKPCYKNYCWRKDKPLECLELIGVDRVYSAVVEQMPGEDW